MNQQLMTSESHIASIDYRATIVVRSFICECDVALEQYRMCAAAYGYVQYLKYTYTHTYAAVCMHN